MYVKATVAAWRDVHWAFIPVDRRSRRDDIWL